MWFLSSSVFLFTLTILVYTLSVGLSRRTGWAILHPILVSCSVLMLYLYLTQIPYQTFARATASINFLLGPSVVALGYALYRQISYLKAHMATILTSMLIGSVVGVVSVAVVMYLTDNNPQITASLLPKSVTTPIAIIISENHGGLAALTVVSVIATGVLGGMCCRFVFRKLRIDSRMAQGLALGASAHGFGTARAMELGALQGAMAGLAMGMMGLITALLSPLFGIFL